MGYLRRSELETAYLRIRRDAAGRACSVLILVAPTVDALCALKILTELLKADFVSFKVVPVSGYSDVGTANENFIQGRTQIKSVIMIDCGGTADLAELLSISPEVTVYLLDSHRPYNLHNVFDNSQLTILDDGYVEENFADLEQAFEFTKLGEEELDAEDASTSSSSSADEGGSGEDDEPANAENGQRDADQSRPSRRSRGGEENRPPNRERASKRRLERLAKRQHRERCRQKYVEYYREGSWYGTPASRLLFDVADALSRHCNDFLWCAVLGVTAQNTMEQCGRAAYDSEVSWLRERCLQLNREADESTSADFASRDGRIRFEPEFRFMLTRHWNLFDSMLHSRYMATRLAVWRERGRRSLETFIVKMGIPLAQCKTDYASMEMELKNSLPARIGRHAAEFGIADASIPSFVRDFGFVMRLTACDAVYAMMALLEAPYGAMESLPTTGGNGAIAPVEDESPIWIRNFYCALDALDYRNIDKLKRGIELAMRQQRIILHEASTVLSHRLLRYGRRFRYVVLRHSSDLAWLSSHPLSLSKLTIFLAEATRSSKRGGTPLLLAAYQSATDTFLVVPSMGLEGGEGAGTGGAERNRFGLAFRRATQLVRARVQHDGFDAAMIEVKGDDLKGFLQILQTIPLA